MKKTIRMAADRYEGAFTVMIPDDGGEAILLPRADYGIAEGEIADVTLEDGRVLQVSVLRDETEKRMNENRSRLSALFAKGRKPN